MKKLHVELCEEDLRSLKHIAATRGVSVASFVRAALSREIDGYCCRAVTGLPKLRIIDGGQSATPGRESEHKWPLRGSTG